MPSLLLFRNHTLTTDEGLRLPVGCFAVPEDDSLFQVSRIVARAQLRAPIPLLLKMAFDMGRAVPDATFGYEEGFVYQENDAYHGEEDALEESSEEEFFSWAALFEAGKHEDAMKALASVVPPTQEDQIELNRFFASKQSEKMVFVCRAAILFQWKSMAMKLRIGMRHADPEVRSAVVNAIGILAGPSLSPAIELMRNDVDEGVRNEVVRALKRLKKS